MKSFYDKVSKDIIIILLIAIVFNLTVIDVKLFQGAKDIQTLLLPQQSPVVQSVIPTHPVEQNANLICPLSCQTLINEATLSATQNSGNSQASTQSSTPQDYYIPVTTGSVSSSDWSDVGGLVTINSTSYKNIQLVYFDASVVVPGANEIVYVRLFNVTDQHPVWYSDLTFQNAGISQTQTSPSITLDPGNKAYQVQMKTQLTFPASLTSSRIHIIAQ